MQYSIAIKLCNIGMLYCMEHWEGGEMNNIGSTGIVSMALISGLLIMGASSSVIFEGSDDLSEDAKRAVNDALEEITTYLKIEEAIGKYYTTNNERRVERIVIFVKQFITSMVNVSELKIKIQNDVDVIVLSYSRHAEKIGSKPIFSHDIWEKTNNSFSIIVTNDNDRSLLDYNIMNKDRGYIAIKLPEGFAMKKSEKISISIIPSKGITSSILCETPSLHISNIISFGEI